MDGKRAGIRTNAVELKLEFNVFRWLSGVEASLFASPSPLDFARGTDSEQLNSTALEGHPRRVAGRLTDEKARRFRLSGFFVPWSCNGFQTPVWEPAKNLLLYYKVIL